MQNQIDWPRRMKPWCKALGASLAKVYSLPAELQPKSVKLGGSRIMLESPQEYLERIAALQSKAAA